MRTRVIFGRLNLGFDVLSPAAILFEFRTRQRSDPQETRTGLRHQLTERQGRETLRSGRGMSWPRSGRGVEGRRPGEGVAGNLREHADRLATSATSWPRSGRGLEGSRPGEDIQRNLWKDADRLMTSADRAARSRNIVARLREVLAKEQARSSKKGDRERTSREISAELRTGSQRQPTERQGRETLRPDRGKSWPRSRRGLQRRRSGEDGTKNFRRAADRLTTSADGAARSRNIVSRSGKREGTCRARPRGWMLSSRYEWSVAVVEVSVGGSVSGSGGELGLRGRPRNGLRPKSASFSDRMP